MIKKLLFVLVFSFSQIVSRPAIDFTIQKDPKTIQSLDTESFAPNTKWYLLEEDIDDGVIQNIDENNFHTWEWKRVKIPGNLFLNKENYKKTRTLLLAKWIEFNEDKNIQYSFRLGVINDRDRTFFNGKLIGKTGEWNSLLPQNYDKVRIYPIPNQLIRFKEKNLLVIKIQLYFNNSGGIEQDQTLIGPTKEIQSRFFKDEFIKLIFLTIYSTVGGYFLFLFIRRRKDRENLFFSLFSFAFVIYNFLRNQLKYEFGFPFLEMKKAEYLIILLLIPFMYHFLRTLFEERYSIVGKILDSFQLCVFGFFFFTSNIEILNFTLANFVQPTWIIYVILIFAILIRNLRKKEKRAIYIIVGITIVLIAAIIDTATNRNYWVFPRIMGYAFLFFNVSLAIILANSFVKLNEEVEDLNKNLEKKVEERTDALNESLNQLQILKEKQDGDYFLTSLLIQPLARIQNRIPSIQFESYVNQKKKFHFRGKDGEIGGDICIVGSLTLDSGEFTVFANADAMGKSIQGAGGALVLGVVFQAVLSRVKSNDTKKKPPELWLKDLYIELQSVFASFDGSMLSSVVLGMVGANGFVYYINAEHPWSILYRDGVSSFIETELSMRKLGFPKNNNHFQIKTFALLEGDVLLIGSDGRDDIGIYNGTDDRFINEDETLILRFVERTEAKLLPLVNEIEKNGEITDDISFLKITYHSNNKNITISESIRTKFLNIQSEVKKGNEKQALSDILSLIEEAAHPNFHSLAGKIYFQNKEWEKAILHFKKSLEGNPYKENFLYMIAKAEYMLGRFTDAVIWSERLFLRNKYNQKNTKLFFHLLDKLEYYDKKSFYLEFLSNAQSIV